MADNQVIIEFVSDTSGLKAAADQLLALGQISKKQYDEFIKANNAANDAAQKAAKSEQDLTKAATNAAKSGKQLNDEFRELTKIIAGGVIDTIAEDFKHLADETKNTTQQFASAKSELRELAKQITSGQLTGKQLEEAKRRAAELKDNIGDVNNEIRMLASDTRRIDLVVEGVRGISAAFSVATSATALFGEENEDLQKALLKVQAAMALATGVQELANIATTKGGIATKAYGFAIQTVDKIQKAFAISSAAAWAAATAGISLLIAGAVTLFNMFDDANDSASEYAAKRAEEQKAENERILKEREEVLAKISSADKEFFDNQESERKRRLAEGQKDTDVEFDQLSRAIEKFQNKLKSYQRGDFDYLGLSPDEEKERIQQINDYINAAVIQRNSILKKADDDVKKSNEDANKAAEEAKKREKEKYDFINAQNKKFIEDQIRMDEMLLSLAEGNSGEQLRIYGEIIEGKKELARVDPDLSPAMKEAIYKTLEADYAKYRDNLLMIAAQATQKANEQDKEALKQLKTNRQLEQGLIEDFGKEGKIARLGITQEILDAEFEANRDSYENYAEFEKKKRDEFTKTSEALKKETEKRREIDMALRRAAIQAAQEISDAILQIEANRRAAQFNAEFTALEERRNSELANKDLTEAQRANIEKKYRRKEAELKKKQWEADKQAALTRAAINGALAIINAFATAPWPLSIIQAASAGIATAAQIAVIASQKAPQFAKGTKKAPPGMKWVGEQGPELINDKGGYAIIPNKESMQIAAKWNVPTLPSVSDDVQTSLQMPVGIDYTRLARTLAMELRNNPQTNIKFDKTGFASYLISQGERKQILNNRYAA